MRKPNGVLRPVRADRGLKRNLRRVSLRKMSSRLAIWTGVLVLQAALAFGQTARPRFDVTSVKPYVCPQFTFAGLLTRDKPPETYTSPGCAVGGRFYARIMLQPVILWAYDVKHYELSGVPNWMRDQSWEIEARFLDHVATGIEQRTSGVTGVDGGVGLDHVVQRFSRGF